jgi:hypothetical protein
MAVAVVVLAAASIAFVASRRAAPAGVSTVGGPPGPTVSSAPTASSVPPAGRVGGVLVVDGPDLVVLDPQTGQRTVVGRHLSGVLSPDRQLLAVQASGYPGVASEPIDVMRADGSQRHQIISDGSNPTWSPDGRHLAYAVPSNNPDTIMVADADGSNAHPVGKGRQPQWSWDGTSIFANTLDEAVRIERIDLETGTTTVLDLGPGTHAQPVPGPDSLLFGDVGRGISRSGLDGANVRPLIACSTAPCSSSPVSPVWSPDGSEIAYVRHDERGDTNTLVIISVDRGDELAEYPLTDGGPEALSWR